MNIISVTDQLNPTQPLVPLNLDKVLFIILHHSDAINYTWQQCNSDHKANGWLCAGYNEIIYKNGDVYIIRGDHIGAQCQNNNSKSYGICCIGNYDLETQMPEAQFNSLVERIRYHMKRLPNVVEVALHKKFNPTNCPGANFPFSRILENSNSFEDSVYALARAGIINSPTYWLENAVPGRITKGEYVRTLIMRMARRC